MSVLNCPQIKSKLVPMIIDGADGTPEILEGINIATVADSGVGIYTVTFVNAFARKPVITATAEAATGVTLVPSLRSVSGSGFVVELTDDASTLVDGVVHLHIWGSDSADKS